MVLASAAAEEYHGRMSMKSLAHGLFAVALLVGSIGCGGGAAGYCESKIACEGGNDLDTEACVVVIEAAEDTASVYGCSDAFDKLFACEEATARCDSEKDRLVDDCDDQGKAYKACVEAASARD